MARKGKAPKTAPVPPPRVDMTLEARRERLLGLGLSREEVEAHLAVTADSTTTEPTTLCTEHVPSEERPLECAKCGKPLALVQRDGGQRYVEALDERDAGGVTERWKQEFLPPEAREMARELLDQRKAEAEARQSEKRFEDAPMTDDEWADIATPEERDAPLCAVMTPEQLAAVLDGEVVHKPAPGEPGWVDPRFRAADDGPTYDATGKTVRLDALWAMRLSILAKEAGDTGPAYVEKLIRRQWVARGKGG